MYVQVAFRSFALLSETGCILVSRLDMADEPTLPRLPPPLLRKGRKRRRPDYGSASVPNTSSDPAVFSGDDDPALDNYMHTDRRKKRYVGAWFDQQPASSDSAMGDDMRRSMLPPPQSRQLRRQLDSGVWMAQDDSTDNDDFPEPKLRPSKIVTPLIVEAAPVTPSSLPIQRSRYTASELHAQRIIQECIDEGKEEVDLYDIGLEVISDGILETINQIAPIPTVTRDVAFERRDPEIKLYFANNQLRQFPAAILNIEHLTVLSLRNTGLAELPPALASLKHLRTLNVAQNSLRFLPGELLDLMGDSLTELQMYPNPFFEPKEGSALSCWGAYEYAMSLRRGPQLDETSRSIPSLPRGRTPVQFSDSAGTVFSDFRLPDPDAPLTSAEKELEMERFDELKRPRGVAAPDISAMRRFEAVGAPSLFDLVLRAAVRYPEPEVMKEAFEACADEGVLLAGHKTLFDRAFNMHRLGGQPCCVCGRNTLVPRTQWIEFREIIGPSSSIQLALSDNLVYQDGGFLRAMGRRPEILPQRQPLVPFLRRGCSWHCIPCRAPTVKESDGQY